MLISWNTTNQCNMFCDHCYREAGARAADELTTDEGKNLINEVARTGFRMMIFSGGEPFLRDDIFELVAHARQRGLRPLFGSNGTLIDKSVAGELQAVGAAAVGISLDSVHPEKHDAFRKFNGGWEAAVQAMAYLREAGVRFQINTTVMDWNEPEIEELTDLAVRLGAAAHHIFFLVPTGRAASIEEESLRAEQYENLLERILRKQQQVDIELKPTCAPQFMRIARQLDIPVRFEKGCLAGTAYCIVGPRGDVQPCAYLDLHLGNVREIPFAKIWHENEVLQTLRTGEYKGECGTCGYRKICGGCRARAYYYHDGDYMAEEPWCLYHGRRGYNHG